MSDIFISYSQSDQKWVKELATTLEALGYDVWWDTELLAGDDFHNVIPAELENAKCVLVVWSKKSITRRWVKAEASRGDERGVLIPLLMESGVKLPMPFNMLQAEDMTQWDGKISYPAFQRLLRAIQRHCEPAFLNNEESSTQDLGVSPVKIRKRYISVASLIILGSLWFYGQNIQSLADENYLHYKSKFRSFHHKYFDKDPGLVGSSNPASISKPTPSTFVSKGDGVDKIYFNNIDRSFRKTIKDAMGISNFGKSYAVIVGIDKFEEFRNLGTKNDPIRLKDYLLKEAGFDYVHLLTGGSVTLQRIEEIMSDTMPRILTKNDRFLFYWSGQAVTRYLDGEEEGYLAVSSSQPENPSTMLSMSNLNSWDSLLPAKQALYLLDACFSGLAKFKSAKSAGHSSSNDQLSMLSRPSRQILTAGASGEETIVSERLGGSVFNRALVDGLRGKANANFGGASKDGIITASELELYLQYRVSKEAISAGWKKSITPSLTQISGVGDFFFMDEFFKGSSKALPVPSGVSIK